MNATAALTEGADRLAQLYARLGDIEQANISAFNTGKPSPHPPGEWKRVRDEIDRIEATRPKRGNGAAA